MSVLQFIARKADKNTARLIMGIKFIPRKLNSNSIPQALNKLFIIGKIFVENRAFYQEKVANKKQPGKRNEQRS